MIGQVDHTQNRASHAMMSILLVVAMALRLITWIYQGKVLNTFLFTFLVSTVPWALIVTLVEHRNSLVLIDPTRQSAGLLFADSLTLPIAFAYTAAWSRRLVRQGNLRQEHKFMTIQDHRYMAGLVVWLTAECVALAFRIHESGVYDVARLNSPSKDWHDFVAVPVMAAGMIWTLVTLGFTLKNRGIRWIHDNRVPVVVTVGMLLVAVALVWTDQSGLDPTFLDIQWDWNTWEVAQPPG